METYSGVPWHRYGLITYVTVKLRDVGQPFGKTALQKLVYLIQEAEEVPCDYTFSFYNYGPYSADLAGDLEYVSALGGVKVRYQNNGNEGFKIEPGDRATELRKRAAAFLDQYRPRIDSTIEKFGRLDPRQLELRASVLFIYRDSVQHGTPLAMENLVKQLELVKLSTESTSDSWAALEDLKRRGFLQAKRSNASVQAT